MAEEARQAASLLARQVRRAMLGALHSFRAVTGLVEDIKAVM